MSSSVDPGSRSSRRFRRRSSAGQPKYTVMGTILPGTKTAGAGLLWRSGSAVANRSRRCRYGKPGGLLHPRPLAKGTIVHAGETASRVNHHERFEITRVDDQEAYRRDGDRTDMVEKLFRLRRTAIGIRQHIAWAWLLRYAQEPARRDVDRRVSHDDQVDRITAPPRRAGPRRPVAEVAVPSGRRFRVRFSFQTAPPLTHRHCERQRSNPSRGTPGNRRRPPRMRGIQHAAASRTQPLASRRTGSPGRAGRWQWRRLARNDVVTHIRPLAALRARAMPEISSPSNTKRARGMPGAQCTRSLVRAGGSKYAHQYSQRRHRNHPAFPTQWLERLIRDLPGDEFLFATVTSRIEWLRVPG